MKNSMFSSVLAHIKEDISLFETIEEVDTFLKNTISRLMKPAGASIGAVFVFDEENRELVFRVGYDKDDYWDSPRCCSQGTPLRFGLDDSEVGKTFADRQINYLEYEASDEHPLQSKILIPILRGPDKLGVFMMGHQEKNAFCDLDQADLLQAVSLLGDILSEAMMLVNIKKETHDSIENSRIIKGQMAGNGIVLGKALPFWSDMNDAAASLPEPGNAQEELALFESVLKASIQQLNTLETSAASDDSEMVAFIFTAQRLMLKDESFTNKIRDLIVNGESAADAVRTIVHEYAERFSEMAELRLAEKAQDVRDLGYRLITNMGGNKDKVFSYSGKIILSRHIYPSDLYRLTYEEASGIVLQGGGVTAHISILAKSLQIPVLISDDKSLLHIPEGTPLLLDADNAKLLVYPDTEQLGSYVNKLKKVQFSPQHYTLKGKTSDGVAVNILANINIIKDAAEASRQGAEGIGLYRSEFPFIVKNDFLSEEQQFRIYRSIVKSQQGKPVVLRTTDIGGDKLLQGRSEAESNPFLGVRGIRFSLANKEMFRDQLRAMLRAGIHADIGIMLPMVSDVGEVIEAKEELELCIAQLKSRGVPFNNNPRIGAMVELPSAALSVRELAEETDFLSIGTNDLIMYLLAVDRTNENLKDLYRSHHPTVLKVLAAITRDAGDKLGEVSVCGDVAADPVLIPFLVGLGIRKLSVSPALIEPVKKFVGSLSLKQMQTISAEMLAIKRLDEMERYINDYRIKYNLSDGLMLNR